MPTEASASATAAKTARSIALNRCDVSVSSTTSFIVRTSSTGCSGSGEWMTSAAAWATVVGGTAVRITSVTEPKCCERVNSYTVGADGPDRSFCFTSHTHATTYLQV